jgi:hypothetical protein
MGSFYGIITIGEIRNMVPVEEERRDEKFIPMNESNVRFVHYPDCQQLTIWLTHPGREYGLMRLKDNNTNEMIGEWPVADKLNGSIQIPWDTLSLGPGSYSFLFDWKKGCGHEIHFTKLQEGLPVKEDTPVPIKEEKKETSLYRSYRDGTGKPVPDEDLLLRKKLGKDIVNKFTRHIEYEGNVRSGTVIYVEGEIRLSFWYEMGGGNCMVYIDIPTEEQWEGRTQLHLSGRKEILEFIAGRVGAEQAPNCRYEIKNDAISYYYE